MSATTGELGDQAAWTSTAEVTTGTVAEKERLVREFMTLQSGMAALQERLATVRRECTQAESENDMLHTYVDGITKNLSLIHISEPTRHTNASRMPSSA